MGNVPSTLNENDKNKTYQLISPKLQNLANIKFKDAKFVKFLNTLPENRSDKFVKIFSIPVAVGLTTANVCIIFDAIQRHHTFILDNPLYGGILAWSVMDILTLTVGNWIFKGDENLPAAPVTTGILLISLYYIYSAVEYIAKLPVKLSAKAIVNHLKKKEDKILALPNGEEEIKKILHAQQVKLDKKLSKKVAFRAKFKGNKTEVMNESQEEKTA